MRMAKWGMGASALVLATAVVMAQQPPAQNPNAQQPPVRNPNVQQPPGQNPNAQNAQDRANQQRIQQQNDQRNAQNRQPGQQDQQASGLDQQLANCFVLGNQAEIAISQWAMEHIRDQRVKQFAQQLVTDHQQGLAKLRQFASYNGTLEVAGADGNEADRIRIQANRPVDGGDAAERRNQLTPQNDQAQNNQDRQANDRQADQLAQRQPGGDPRMASGGDTAAKLFEVEKKATAECLRLTKECLEKAQGEEFDQAFLGMQVAAHISMQAKLKAAEEAASPELRQVISDSQTKVKEHREHAEQLMKDLKTASSSNPRQPGQQPGQPGR